MRQLQYLTCGLLVALLYFTPLAARAQSADGRMAEDQYLFATELFGRKLYELAIQEYEKYLKEYPQHAKTHLVRLRIGEAYLRLNKYPESIAAYERALAEKPDMNFRAEALVGLGLGHFYSKQYDKALPHLLEAKQLADKDEKLGPIAYNWLGECYFQLEKWDEAIAAYQAVAERWPASEQAAQATYSLGFCHYRKGNSELAASTWLQVAEKYPQAEVAAEALLRAGETLLGLKQYALAEKAYQKVLEAYKGSEQSPAAQMGLAWAAFYQKNYPAARAAFEAVAASYPKSSLAASVPLRVADCYYYEKNYAAAAERYEVGSRDPDPAVAREALYWLAMARLQLKQVEQAAAAFQRLAEDGGAGALALRARLRLGDLRLDTGNPADAARLYRAVLDAKPAEQVVVDQATYGLGVAFYRQRQFPAAEEQFTAVMRRDPKGPLAAMATIGLAQCRFEGDDAIGAVAQLGELLKLELEPDARAAALLLIGQAYYRLKQPDNAVPALREVLDKHGDSTHASTAAATLLSILREQKKSKEAADVEKILLEKYGDKPAAAQALLANADSLRAAGSYAAAIQVYQQVLQRAPRGDTVWAAHTGLALCYAATGKSDLLAETLKALEKAPEGGLARAQFLIGSAYEKDGKLDLALAAYQAALKADPPAEMVPSVMLRIGTVLASQNKYADAITAFNQLVAKYPKSTAVPEALYEMAWAFTDDNQPDQARPVFARLASEFAAHPLGVDALFRLAEQDYKAGKFTEAAQGYRTVASSPQAGNLADKAWYKLGWCLHEAKDWAGSAEAFLVVVQRYPQSDLLTECRLRAGEALLQKNDLGPAAEQLQRVAELKPPADDKVIPWLVAQARLALGQVLVRQGQPEKAVTVLEPLFGTSYGRIGAEAGLLAGDALYAQKKYEDARRTYLRVATLFGRYKDNQEIAAMAAQAQYQAGECFAQLGQQKEAQEAWGECLKTYKDTEWAMRAQERLGQKPVAP
ncbi:MAG: tetratricopeptide repeat protein [Armatimonadetes bacterium]|nr:tetratricopeptide repeat protein [Armatimonadota bacterium]